jgi:chemotaxis protein methyltransferase CheR
VSCTAALVDAGGSAGGAVSLRIERQALEQLAALLLDRAGLKLTPAGYPGLRLALQARMPALGIADAAEYVGRLRHHAGRQELRALIPLVTVGKTEFFRDGRQFSAFAQHVFPQVLERARQEGRAARLWSAGCATGEEPYSLAMVALERGGTKETVEIRATDLNPSATESAARGCYPARRLVGVSEERVRRFFSPREGGYRVIDPVRALVTFECQNLAAPAWSEVEARSLDVILCRNVIIYFDQATTTGVLERFYEALRPGGWLLLGYSESLLKSRTRFEMVEVGGTFAYQRPSGAPKRSTGTVPVVPPRPSAPPPPPAPKPAAPSPSRGTPRPPPTQAPVERLAEVIAAIEAGDFPRALRTAHRLSADEPDDLAARLTQGNIYVLMGNLGAAREVYASALATEPLCVEVRLYTALAALQGGQLEDARHELQRALFLEPTLAVGHYLLGQVHERRGDQEGALRSYRNAISQRRHSRRELIGYFPDLPSSHKAIAQAARYRVAALSER